MLLKNKKEIEIWLNKYNVRNYELIKDDEYGYIVNVNEAVNLWDKELNSIGVKFNQINGWFDCSSNNLKSLEGCPKVVNGNLNCSFNVLSSLKGCSKIIEGSIYCFKNQLTSLVGCPETVKGDFICSYNDLKTLRDGPKIVNGEYNCSYNKLTSLIGFPEIILEKFYCKDNLLNLEGIKLLELVEIKENYIYLDNNTELNELQKINDFNEIKKILKIYQEKERLDLLIKNKCYNLIDKKIIRL